MHPCISNCGFSIGVVYRMNGNSNCAAFQEIIDIQERKLLQSNKASEIIAGAKVNACLVPSKKFAAFSRMFVTRNWCFERFAVEQHVNGCLLLT